MAVVSTTRATERLSRKLQRAGIDQWVAISSGDAWGKYLRFEIGGKCIGSCGWTLREAEEIVEAKIHEHETMTQHIANLEDEGQQLLRDGYH